MFGCARFIYNNTLTFSTEQYRDNKESTNISDWNDVLNILKEENSWLRDDVSSVALQQAQQHLYSAFSRFYKKLGGYPQYKSKYSKQSFSLLKNFVIEDRYLKIPKIDPIKIIVTKDLSDYTLKNITISKNKTGTYIASISYETGLETPIKSVPTKEQAIGIDLGIKDYAIISDGTKIANPKFLEKVEKNLKRQQRSLSKKEKGSKNREKARKNLAKGYERVTNLRSDFLHKLTTNLVCDSQGINTLCVENLNVSGMIKNHSLAKAIQSASWGEFYRQLKYKCEWNGVNLLECGRFDATSQTCSNCFYKNSDVKNLSVRFWTCPECGVFHDRDINSARSIVDFAFNKLKDTEGHRKSSGLNQRKSVESKTVGRSQFLLPTKSMLNLKEAEIYCVPSSIDG